MNKSTKTLFIFLILVLVLPITLYFLSGGIIFGATVPCPEPEMICYENGACSELTVFACTADIRPVGLHDNFDDFVDHFKIPYTFLLLFDAVVAGMFFGIRGLYNKIKHR